MPKVNTLTREQADLLGLWRQTSLRFVAGNLAEGCGLVVYDSGSFYNDSPGQPLHRYRVRFDPHKLASLASFATEAEAQACIAGILLLSYN